MLLVLCEPEDRDVLWLATALLRQGADVEFLLPEELTTAALTLRIDASGATASLRTRDDRVIGPGTADLIINRLVDLPANDAYAHEEWRAATTAWLRAVPCPVLNPPRAASLAGPTFSEAQWRFLARRCSLEAQPWDSRQAVPQTDLVDVLVLGERFIDPTRAAPEEVAAGMKQLARLVGAPLLGASFRRANGSWQCVSATARPSFEAAGSEVVRAVLDMVGDRAP